MKTISECVKNGTWESFFINENKERIEFTKENHSKWLTNHPDTKKWVYVSKEK